MSYLSDYEHRTSWKRNPFCGQYPTNYALSDAITVSGQFRPFNGATVAFHLSDDLLGKVLELQDCLYAHPETASQLADRLPGSALHLLVHDLVSPEYSTVQNLLGPDGNLSDDYRHEITGNITQALGILKTVRREFMGERIRMRADRIVNLLSKSLVLLLRPETEQDFERFMAIYRSFDPVATFDYPPTPHITLAYFRPGNINADTLAQIIDTIQIRDEDSLIFDFPISDLCVRMYRNLAEYSDIVERICFLCDDGLGRSVMAASIFNHIARQRGLPLYAEGRSATSETDGRTVPEPVWQTLMQHGISCTHSDHAVRYLADEEVHHFSQFAVFSDKAADRVSLLDLPSGRYVTISRYFFGIRDPAFETTYEKVFADIYTQCLLYLDAYAASVL
ncbi:MAG: hypothetical protein IJ088_00345 [Clostridia bacterium]|nr:hypothetical protein [Clostridia bacterium]